jgi:hypothetical protein
VANNVNRKLKEVKLNNTKSKNNELKSKQDLQMKAKKDARETMYEGTGSRNRNT